MSLHLKEKEVLILPCKMCWAVSLRVTVAEGTATVACLKCVHSTRVTFEREGEGWRIRIEPLGGEASIWD